MPAASEDDITRVAQRAERVLDLASAGLGERPYRSLPPCVLDAVFSIGAIRSGAERGLSVLRRGWYPAIQVDLDLTAAFGAGVHLILLRAIAQLG